jgi:spore coat polysaccharide biosynthesis protein SpsF
MYDVLDRYCQAARQYQAEIIVRITADCPLIDPGLIDELVTAFIGNGDYPYDFAANRLPPPWKRSYPIGLDLEACSFQALETAWREATQPHQREHVMPFFYDQPDRFRLLLLDAPQDYGTLRWTVDTQQDLDLLRQIIARFNGRQDFSWLEVLDLFQREPELAAINAAVPPKHYQDTDRRAQA